MRVKLTHELAQTIRDRAADGVLHKTLAYEYGVSKATISMIITGKIWKSNERAENHFQGISATTERAFKFGSAEGSPDNAY